MDTESVSERGGIVEDKVHEGLVVDIEIDDEQLLDEVIESVHERDSDIEFVAEGETVAMRDTEFVTDGSVAWIAVEDAEFVAVQLMVEDTEFVADDEPVREAETDSDSDQDIVVEALAELDEDREGGSFGSNTNKKFPKLVVCAPARSVTKYDRVTFCVDAREVSFKFRHIRLPSR